MTLEMPNCHIGSSTVSVEETKATCASQFCNISSPAAFCYCEEPELPFDTNDWYDISVKEKCKRLRDVDISGIGNVTNFSK